MKPFLAFSALSVLLAMSVVVAQDAPAQPDQNSPAGRRDPNIVSPRATLA